ncbi:MAG: hypothetical protein KY467_08915 [Gemmatimonadetes bacterium]|nr:hypothetical protein [Gemmatimonadota bacterium]
MNTPAYRPLSRELIGVLLSPENTAAEQSWSRLAGALHSNVSMLSVTHPRPLYWNDEFNRQRIAEEPARLRGTPFFEPAVANVRAAQEIERMARERRGTPEVQDVVEQYLDALLDEFDAIRFYPERPPVRPAGEENGLAGDHRAVAAR